MGLRWVSVLATASAAASWMCSGGAWKLYRNHEFAINNFSKASDSFLEAQWGFPYVAVPRTENSDGSVSFIFSQAVQGYVKGHEPPETSEGPGSTENADSDEGPSDAGQVGSTGGPNSSEEISGTQGGEASTSPEHTGGSSGSTQGSASSETVESAPSEGASGNGEAWTGSTQEPSSPENVESSTEGNAGDGGEPTLPDEDKVEEEKAELEDIDIGLGPCRFEEMSVTGPGEYSFQANVQTLQACHEICLNDPRCNWYTYNSPNKKCHLKSQAGPIRHVIGGDITSPKYCDSSCFMKNRKVLGVLLGPPNKRATAFNCHYECHFRSNCYYWSWDSTTGECHLFGKTNFQGKTAARGFVSGPRDGCGVEAKEGGISSIP